MPRGYTVIEAREAQLNPDILGASAEAIAYRQSMGCTCLVALDSKQQAVGAIWITDHPFHEDEADLRYVPGSEMAWDLGLYIVPEYRLGRTFAALWAGVGAWMDQRALKWSCSRITDYNLESRAPHARLGAKVIGTVWAFSLSHWQWTGSSLWKAIMFHRIGRDKVPSINLHITQLEGAGA